MQVMVAAHSWGENVFRNFLAWVERREPGWTEQHIAVFVNIAGSVLGVPKVGCSNLIHLNSERSRNPNCIA